MLVQFFETAEDMEQRYDEACFNHSPQAYKAVPPEETIHTIRSILHRNDLLVIEAGWFRAGRSSVSVGLTGSNFPLITAGKGRDAPHALASAYAEFMERLQNLALLDAAPSSNGEAAKIVPPDGTTQTVEQYFSVLQEEALNTLFTTEVAASLSDIVGNRALQLYPFHRVNTGTAFPLPRELILLFCGTNGMCAGNTPEEAIIQGVCEIFERHALKEIYLGCLDELPSLPLRVLKNLPQWRHADGLRKEGFDVQIKDCTLGGKWPVVGLLLRKGDRAVFNLGSSPDLGIAIERCFTEALQGMDYHSIESKMQSISALDSDVKGRSFSTSEKRIAHQYFRSLRSGSGVVCSCVFEDSKAPFHMEAFSNCDLTAKKTLSTLLKRLLEQGYDVFIRDVSFMGFPSYHVFVPGLSEVLPLCGDDLKLRLSDLPKARQTLSNLEAADSQQKLEIARTIDNLLDDPYFERSGILPAIWGNGLNKGVPLDDLDPENLLVALYIIINDYHSAHKTLKAYIQRELERREMHSPPEWAKEHTCLLEILRCLKNGDTLIDSLHYAEGSYPASTVGALKYLLSDSDSLIRHLALPNCCHCEHCQHKLHCPQEALNEVGALLKRKVDIYDFDQSTLAEELS